MGRIRKGHITWHDIELFLEEKLEKTELMKLKDRYKKHLKNEWEDLERVMTDEEDFVCEYEMEDFLKKAGEEEKILNALRLIFPEDIEIGDMIEELEHEKEWKGAD
jgi:DNA polymerase III delta prime subunit